MVSEMLNIYFKTGVYSSFSSNLLQKRLESRHFQAKSDICENVISPTFDNYRAYANIKKPQTLSFRGKTADIISKAIIVTADGDIPMLKRYDGSYLVDDAFGTIVYYGKEALRYLKNVTHFTDTTQIITQSDGKINVLAENGKTYNLREPGAIIINKGTYAKVNVEEGNPLVVINTKQPEWYKKMLPNNEHKAYFDELTQKNKLINKGIFNKKALESAVLPLCENSIITPVGDNSFCFNAFDNFSDFKMKLEVLEINSELKLKIENLYKKSINNKSFQTQNPGEVKKEDFYKCPDWVFEKLINTGILTLDSSNKTCWADFYKRDEFEKELYDKSQIYGSLKDALVDIWDRTTKSGYDLTGLKDYSDGITIYSHADKLNQFTSQHTEWITNSSEWTPRGAVDIGVSRVASNKNGVMEFNRIRSEEQLHRHYNASNPEQVMTEIYVPTQGVSALCAVQKGQSAIKTLSAGEMIVIQPGVMHGVVAVKGEYEHLCCQSPSTFQYGFKFKNDSAPFSSDIVFDAINKINGTKYNYLN